MLLKERITEDLRAAMKKGDAVLVSTLRLALNAVHNKEIEKHLQNLEDADLLLVLAAEARKRKEATIEYERGGRRDLAEKETQELAVLKRYLPAELTAQELRPAVQRAIERTGAGSAKDIGKVMSAAMQELKGRADGNAVRRIAEELLQKPSSGHDVDTHSRS